MLITKEWLDKRVWACDDTIKFFGRNFPNGLDLDKYEIKGDHDYKSYAGHLKVLLDSEFEFDDHGSLIKEVRPDYALLAGQDKQLLHSYKYDQNGKVIEKKANGYTRIFERDSFGRKIKETISKDNSPNNKPEITVYEYDHNGNLIMRQMLGGSNVFTWEYDDRGNEVKEFINGVIKYVCEYDENGDKTKETSSSGNICTLEYDKHRNLSRRYHTDREYLSTWEFDDFGNETRTTDSLHKSDDGVYKFIYNTDNMLVEIWKNDDKICWLEAKS